MTFRARTLSVVLALGAAAALAACGGGDGSVAAGDERRIAHLADAALPSDVLGLAVGQEDVSELLAHTPRPYVEAVGLYSFRDGDLLQATLQVSRFADGADHTDGEFRRAIVNRIGTAQVHRVGDHTVWITRGRQQQISVWFDDAHMFVLSVREDYPSPRALLRQVLEVQP